MAGAVVGSGIAEFKADHWTPVIYKAYASRPASSPKPLSYPNATFEAANPNAGNTVPQLAVARRLPTYRLRARRLASLYNAASTCHRSHRTLFASSFVREVNCDYEMSQPPRLTKALQAKLQITLPDEFCLRIHPTNN
ncbi:hypothetical protein MTO96_039060 [Rhipicephalus appendiculatus]